MIGKIVKGTSFAGWVNYVLKEDKSRLLKAVGVYGSPEEIAEQFELQTLLNDKVKNKVGHISLSFSAEDGDRIRDDDGLMLKIAHDYMKRKHSVNHVFSSPTSIINFTSKKPSYDDTRRSGRDNELLQRAQNDL